MTERPTVNPGDWIRIGTSMQPQSAVVCAVYDDDSDADIEVVYLDYRDRMINEDMTWKEGSWSSLEAGPSGGYADNSSRLARFVRKLRTGR